MRYPALREEMKTAAGPEINFFTPTEVDMSEAARDRQRRRAGGTVPTKTLYCSFTALVMSGLSWQSGKTLRSCVSSTFAAAGVETHEIRNGSRGSLGHCAAISNNARGPSELTGLRGITILWRFPA